MDFVVLHETMRVANDLNFHFADMDEFDQTVLIHLMIEGFLSRVVRAVSLSKKARYLFQTKY